jgi:hypothetical protein
MKEIKKRKFIIIGVIVYFSIRNFYFILFYFLTFEFDIVNNKFGNVIIKDVINKGRNDFGPVIHFPLKKK